jgi:hypothetical protein
VPQRNAEKDGNTATLDAAGASIQPLQKTLKPGRSFRVVLNASRRVAFVPCNIVKTLDASCHWGGAGLWMTFWERLRCELFIVLWAAGEEGEIHAGPEE